MFQRPFVDTRAAVYGISLMDTIGFGPDNDSSYVCRCSIHLDCIL